MISLINAKKRKYHKRENISEYQNVKMEDQFIKLMSELVVPFCCEG